jgi:hypothetical protein
MDELRQRRRQKAMANRPATLRQFLHDLFTGYVDGDLEAMPNSVVVILIGGEGPSVHWAGAPSTPELRAASTALQRAIQKHRPWPCPEDIEDMQRRHEENRIRHEEYLKSHPFECPKCSRRFATERGRSIHERKHKRGPESS